MHYPQIVSVVCLHTIASVNCSTTMTAWVTMVTTPWEILQSVKDY